jgi:hypothetical protein
VTRLRLTCCRDLKLDNRAHSAHGQRSDQSFH